MSGPVRLGELGRVSEACPTRETDLRKGEEAGVDRRRTRRRGRRPEGGGSKRETPCVTGHIFPDQCVGRSRVDGSGVLIFVSLNGNRGVPCRTLTRVLSLNHLQIPPQ